MREGRRIISYPRIFVTKHGGWGEGGREVREKYIYNPRILVTKNTIPPNPRMYMVLPHL